MIISILQDFQQKDIPLITESVSVLVKNNHTVLIEGDEHEPAMKRYLSIGGYVIDIKEEVLDRGQLIIKKSALLHSELQVLSGENKIVVATIAYKDKKMIEQLLKSRISFINYAELKNVKKKNIDIKKKTEFSHYLLPFVLELANSGTRALVEDEILRAGLLCMDGKVFNSDIARLYGLQCHEF